MSSVLVAALSSLSMLKSIESLVHIDSSGVHPADGSKAAAEVEGKVWLAPGLSDQQLRTALQVMPSFKRVTFEL